MIKRILFSLLLIGNVVLLSAQNIDRTTQNKLNQFFNNYTSSSVNIGRSKLEKVDVNHSTNSIAIYADARFAYQPFREQNVQAIYRHISQLLPSNLSNYNITVYAGARSIDDLIPNVYRSSKIDPTRVHKPINTHTAPWVTRVSTPYKITHGLAGRHVSLWQSHGKYYINKLDKWGWQRPHLFSTTEDQFTQSFINPFLIPMLENAGANVFTPRERDIQKNEVIVDNDIRTNSLYIEEGKRKERWFRFDGPGFAHSKETYLEGENPFLRGTSRMVETKRKGKAFAQWVPTIPQDGYYAVYVTYQSVQNSISDAQYKVFHSGGVTEFSVNQQIGGSTWVYLGTFHFAKGNSPLGMVVLTNESSENGVVSADAVRFGGGMGNIVRGNSTSGVPRYLEGARYTAQWSGMPTTVYSGKQGTNDYIDDINTRSNMINYLSGGSVFNPNNAGLRVPLELNIGLHSDAGYLENDKIVGTLGIYTTEANTSLLGSGKDRISSRDLTDIALTQIEKDIHTNFDVQWTRRSMWDRNYSETRLPEIPSTIIELLSHQNFADMRLGHDPHFKFVVARAIYKSVLQFLSEQHKQDYVVQPLPIKNFSVELTNNDKAHLIWSPTIDPFEPSASPRQYVVYTRVGSGGFDNGVLVNGTDYKVDIKPGLIHSFKVTAVNKGGESFPSETLVAYKAPNERAEVLIVNGFQRIGGPATVTSQFDAGFDLDYDPGVPYQYDISLTGKQINFRRADAGKSGSNSHGHSTDELEGLTIMGNTFDYPYLHGKAMLATPGISFSSASKESVEIGRIRLSKYPIIDYIAGLEKEEKYNPSSNRNYKTFSGEMQLLLRDYTMSGGSLFVSGSYLGSDMNANIQERSFTQEVLKYGYAYSILDKNISKLTGLGRNFIIPRYLNELYYAVTQPEVLIPMGEAFPALAYQELNHAAAVAYKGNYNTFVMGFPFESITTEEDRMAIMASILHFLMN